MPPYLSLVSRGIRLLRTPAWRRGLAEWLESSVAPRLVSSRGDAHLREVLAAIAPRLSNALMALDRGASVLDERTFAEQLHHALDPLAFSPEIVAKGAKIRAYCDISASLALVEALLPKLATELSLNELDVAMRLAAAAENWREPLVAAGRRMLEAGRHEDAAVYARRALDLMTSCPISQKLLMDALRARRAAGATLTEAEENGLADLRGRFCPRPFEVIVSGQGVRWNEAVGTTEQVMGSTYACDCAAWVPFVTGNMLEGESPDAVWNSAGMQEVRRSVLDGDFSYCSRTSCPAIVNAALPRTEEVTAPRLRRIIEQRETVVSDGPRLVALGHDSSCNLACPTCRHDLVMANREQSERLERGRDKVILPLLRGRDIGVQMTSWGDPFASRHYRSILEALHGPEYDGVRLFILTNGLGLTPHTWKAMPQLAEKIVELRVSVDAAAKATYENVRRPGRWEVIRENLGAMAELDRAGIFMRNRSTGAASVARTDLNVVMEEPYSFVIAFVVQSANFREMPEFVRLGEELGAAVVFQKYYSFGHEPAAVFASKDVTSPAHPDHDEFQAILRDPIMQSPNVSPAFLRQLETRSA
ncbi:MAG TPA: radical SAM/SPASM domain-containing protein [Thermoanaerobaculia bacterium]|nr:radical SAM/SPASM domain-containing protein [Thermoanaerobaculia bacterium]